METIDSVRPICNISIMSDHDDSIPGLPVECIDEIHDLLCISLIEIPGRLICEEVCYICDECSRDRDTLLLSS